MCMACFCLSGEESWWQLSKDLPNWTVPNHNSARTGGAEWDACPIQPFVQHWPIGRHWTTWWNVMGLLLWSIHPNLWGVCLFAMRTNQWWLWRWIPSLPQFAIDNPLYFTQLCTLHQKKFGVITRQPFACQGHVDHILWFPKPDSWLVAWLQTIFVWTQSPFCAALTPPWSCGPRTGISDLDGAAAPSTCARWHPGQGDIRLYLLQLD